MRIVRITGLVLGGVSFVAASIVSGCSSDNNAPSVTNQSTSSNTPTNGASSSGTSSTTGGSSTTAGSGTTIGQTSNASTSAATGTAPVNVSDAGVCPSTLKDKMTTCTVGTDPACTKGCGPDLPSGSSQSNLGNKTCTCTAGVYVCSDCVYESPPPVCFTEGASPPACDPTVADKGACTTPCTTGTGNDVCTMTTDAGKAAGCVCITGATSNVWTCATLPWQ
jgi:hypothetical protein